MPRSDASRERARVRAKEWYNRNAEAHIAKVAAWKKAHRAKVNASVRSGYAAHLRENPRPIRRCIVLGCGIVLESHQKKYCTKDWAFFKKNPVRGLQ